METKTLTDSCGTNLITTDGEIVTVIRTAHADMPGLVTRAKWDGSREIIGTGCTMITLSVSQTSKGYRVSYARNGGDGWRRGKQSKELFATEALALAWAAPRWDVLMTWLRATTPVSGRGCPDIVTMR